MQAQLTNIAKPTKQQIFDAVVRHAAQMPAKSQSPGDTSKCVYRTPDGTNACFIGCLLTDEEAAPLDAKASSGIGGLLAYPTDLVPERLRDWDLRHFLPRLQTIHDQHRQEAWPGELRGLAHNNQLDTTVLEEVFPS